MAFANLKGIAGKAAKGIGGLLGAGWQRNCDRDSYTDPSGREWDSLQLRQMANTKLSALQAGMMGNYNDYITGFTTTADSGVYYTNVQYALSGGSTDAVVLAPSKPKPESALEWLDRRVEEMRVAL